jgi:hypothetical protein
MQCGNSARRFQAAARVGAGVLLVLAGLAPPASATTLVVLVGRRAIVIGADSMRTLAGGGTQTVCKVHEAGDVVFAFAGAVNSERFDATTIAARELASRRTDLGEKARRIADALQAGLVEHFKSRRIDGTRHELIDGQRGRPVTGFIAALIDGKPQGFLVQVLAAPSADGVTLTTKVEPLDTLGPDRAIFLSSQHQEVIDRANRVMADRERASVSELVAAAGELVNLDLALEGVRAIAERKSGPPVTIAVLERDGFRFADPGVCPPAGSPPRRTPAAR